MCLLLAAGPATSQIHFELVSQDISQVSLPGARSAAFGDYNNDGWPDLFLLASWFLQRDPRHVLLTGDGRGSFELASAEVDIRLEGHTGGGGIWGDFDNDGDLDVFVPRGDFSADLPNHLLRNDSGRFVDVAQAVGLVDDQATDNAVWLDYDRDGWLDLYTGNWLTPETRNLLYWNLGDGTFADVTVQAGLGAQIHPIGGGNNGGMIAADFDGDDWPDLYLTYAQGGFIDATTVEIADEGEAFGVAAGGINNDGHIDLFVTGGSGGADFRSFMLLNLGRGNFVNVTPGGGVAGLVGNENLGASLGDFDNDGDLDLLVGGDGHLFINNGSAAFVEQKVTSGWGSTIALGDYDRDGRIDVIGGGGPTAVLYRNVSPDNHWLSVELVDTVSNRNGIGSRILIETPLGPQTRQILGGTGFTQDEMIAHFGLGVSDEVRGLAVHWPSGHVDEFGRIEVDRRIRIVEASG